MTELKRIKSKQQYEIAKQFIPGGVNSPVRAFKSVKGDPIFIAWACGSHVWDIDSNQYIDYVASWGPLILGHSHLDIIEALKVTACNGTTFGAPTEHEIKMAQLVCELVPSVEMLRFCNSGTEAVAGAIRLARAYTKRNKIVKFSGCYHGCVEPLLVEAGSGVATLGLPSSPGIPYDVTKDTIIIDFNDFESAKEAFKLYGKEIATVILEPAMGNAGCILPKEGFLELLRELCSTHGTLLIFDEVMTGFRLAMGGAQEYFNVMPDLTTMAKIIGGGLPVGAFGGKKEIMEMLSPAGPVYQAGTLSGNPLAMIAGYTTLDILKKNNPYKALQENTTYLCNNFKEIAQKAGVPVKINHVGSMFSVFFTDQEVYDFRTAKSSNIDLFIKYFNKMLENNIYLAPSQFEANFISMAHNKEDLDETIIAFEKSIATL